MSSNLPDRDRESTQSPAGSRARASTNDRPPPNIQELTAPRDTFSPRRASTWNPEEPAFRSIDDNDRARPGERGARRARAGTTTSLRPPSISSLRRRTTSRMSAGILRQPTTQAGRPSMNVSTGYTLAGPDGAPPGTHTAYVDPGYIDLNPAYEQPGNARPVWGLAKPMPRVLRPGMVPTQSEINQAMQQESAVQQSNQMSSDLEKGSVRPADAIRRPEQTLNRVRSHRRQTLVERLGPDLGLAPVSSQVSSQASRRGRRFSVAHPHPHHEPATLPPFTEVEEPPDEEDERNQLEQHPTGEPWENDNDDAHSDLTQIDEEAAQEWAELKRYNGLEDEVHNNHTTWSVVRTHYREELAEFLAVLIQLLIGFSADLQIMAGENKYGSTGDWAWGCATMIGIYIAGGISGAHLNPAVTIMLYMYRGFPRRKIPGYICAQILGAFCAALVAYGLYKDAIIEYSGSAAPGADSTVAEEFVTSLRQTWIGAPTGFFNEFVGTAVLGVIILALGDDKNAPPGAGMSPLIFAFIIFATSSAFSYNTGAALNPSRDLGPRLALLCLGFGKGLFTTGWFAYGPIAATISGALFGGALYDVAIFTGGESPINYPIENFERSIHKFKRRWALRFKRREIPDTYRR